MKKARSSSSTGAVVHGNSKFGIVITKNGICTIDGGEVRNNNYAGIYVTGNLTMRSGAIRNNKSFVNGGGVFIDKGGRFTMTGGSITGNSAPMAGGGVYVLAGGRFDQSGGTISGNTAGQGSNPNVFSEKGSLG